MYTPILTTIQLITTHTFFPLAVMNTERIL